MQLDERNLSLITNVIPTNIHVLRTDGSVLYVNQAVLDYHGCTLEDVQREDYRARFFHPEDVERLREERLGALTRPVPFENEQRALGKDGRYRWFLIRYKPLLDEQGRVDRWYVAAFDIEDRKLAEEELRRSEAFLAETQHLSSIGSFCWRVRTDEITWSEETYRIFELDQGVPVTLELIASRVHPDDLPLLFEMIDRVRDEASDFEYEHRLLLPDHSVKHLHLVAHGRRDGNGQLEYIGAVQDVTESKAADEALTRARSELAHMARVTTLSALTASLAHEVNQPITAAVTNANTCVRWLAGETPNIEEARAAAIRSARDGTRAADIISRVRLLFKKGTPERKFVDVNEIVREMIVLLHNEAARHSISVRTQLDTDLPQVMGDRVQLQQVMMNLIMNGIDATKDVDGTRELIIKSRGAENEQLHVSVSDTGVGLPSQQADEIFNAFFTTKLQGTGLGLPISRSIVESHGGRIWADGNSARGATFNIALPTGVGPD
jgi:PAS domain S-box-containing protein